MLFNFTCFFQIILFLLYIFFFYPWLVHVRTCVPCVATPLFFWPTGLLHFLPSGKLIKPCLSFGDPVVTVRLSSLCRAGGHGPGPISQADRTNTLEESQNNLERKGWLCCVNSKMLAWLGWPRRNGGPIFRSKSEKYSLPLGFCVCLVHLLRSLNIFFVTILCLHLEYK